ncbi:type IV secretion system protein [Anaerobiospirillum sp. NML120449]|uniref:type IV secretion system protein n=1 Tax=Anaerobiospirillum sp. NML120449 TaxID=2932817 RepID=UPI001FF51CCB|nr:type IV secretion system protein [Anaerobiospirillum sp. NML120449]MCK0525395.1 type IV secretion system protein [Anaerobiospirillum sp. NML120449]
MDAFSNFGAEIQLLISDYGSKVSSSLIDLLTPVISTGIVLFFTARGFLVLSGRAQGTIPDVIVDAGKISLIAFFALTGGNYLSYAVSSMQGLETFLAKVLSDGTETSPWGVIDKFFQRTYESWQAMEDYTSSKYSGFDYIRHADVTLPLLGVAGAFLAAGTILCIVIALLLVIANFSFALMVGFGPLFICMLMFPVTRSWFDGWFRTTINTLFVGIFANAIAVLSDTVLKSYTSKIFSLVTSGSKTSAGQIIQEVLIFICIIIAIIYLVKNVNNLASSLTGGSQLAVPNARDFTQASRDLSNISKNLSKGLGGAVGAGGKVLGATGRSIAKRGTNADGEKEWQAGWATKTAGWAAGHVVNSISTGLGGPQLFHRNAKSSSDSSKDESSTTPLATSINRGGTGGGAANDESSFNSSPSTSLQNHIRGSWGLGSSNKNDKAS